MLSEEVWWPSIEFVNASGGGSLDRHWLTIDADGHVAYTARFNALVTSSMHLRQFPFDSQSLYIPIESYFHPSSDVVFVVDEGSTGFDPSNSLAEWDVLSVATSVDENDYAQLGEFFGSYSRFVFDIRIKRQWGFHLWKVFLPLLVIMACSWTVFWIQDLATNVGIAFTILLTVVAFNLAIADTLPKVPYLTFMDSVMVVSYVGVFLSLLVVMAGRSSKTHLNRARELCLGMEANILGLIVGNIQEAAPDYLDMSYYTRAEAGPGFPAGSGKPPSPPTGAAPPV